MVILDAVCCYVIITALLGDEWLYLMESVAM